MVLMYPEEREVALQQMQLASDVFYQLARQIGNHPFIEFTGLMNEYIKICKNAHESGVDFTECNKHSNQHLPMLDFEINYINEKLECIFTGRSIMSKQT